MNEGFQGALRHFRLCWEMGDHDGALFAARQAVSLDATIALGWLCLAHVLRETRRYPECRDCFERALELDPRSALIRVEFAGVLQELGRYEEALAQADLAVAEQPDLLVAHLRAAAIEMQLGRHWTALERLSAVEKSRSGGSRVNDATLLALKAHLLRHLDRYDEALVVCREAVAHGIESADLTHAHGLALQAAGAANEALAVFDQLAAATPKPAGVLSDKAVLLTELGRLEEARETFERALLLAPTLSDAWYNKANTKTFAPDDPDLAAMERVLGGNCTYRDRLLLHFALGKAYMDGGHVDAAFRHWHDGNRMKRAIVDYDAATEAARMAAVAARPTDFGSSRRRSEASLSELPVFIVGMPRSGSSLVEQILASLPEVRGVGESSGLRALFEESLPALSDPTAAGVKERIAAAALERLRRFAARDKRVVDKDLKNFLHLDTIHRVLPRARIIHCRRDPLDTCFSAYTKLFFGDLNFSYELSELGHYFLSYHSLMQHWRALLPPEVFLEIDYETLVLEPRIQTSRLLEFLGLPWNDACLRFFENGRKVSTASVAQVRLPIYRSSVGRARQVRQHLQPLVEVLEGPGALDRVGAIGGVPRSDP